MKQRNINKLFVLLITNSILVSCGVYQNTSNNDGIYGDEVETIKNKKVVIVNEKQYDDYETNYFFKKTKQFRGYRHQRCFYKCRGL